MRFFNSIAFAALLLCLVIEPPPLRAFPTSPTALQFPTTNYQTAISFAFGTPNPDYQGKLHVGEDIRPSTTGMLVYAAGTGTVVLARLWPSCADGNWGYVLVMEHMLLDGSTVTTIYGHLDPSSVTVAEGQAVGIGMQLGKTGNYAKDGVLGNPSPCPTWPEHLHFGIHLGPYGSAIGVYAPWLHGYLPPTDFPEKYVKPSTFITNHPRGKLIFTNFGPATNPQNGGAWALGDGAGLFNVQIGLRFQVPGSGLQSLSSIEFVPALLPGPNGANQVTLSIRSDSNGLPGTALESWTFNGMMGTGLAPYPLTATSVVNPMLSGGTFYWVTASAPSGTMAEWIANTIGDTSDGTNFAFNIGGGGQPGHPPQVGWVLRPAGQYDTRPLASVSVK